MFLGPDAEVCENFAESGKCELADEVWGFYILLNITIVGFFAHFKDKVTLYLARI